MANVRTYPGDPKVIAVLRTGLVAEAHLNLQYRMDTRLLKYMGAKKLSHKVKKFGDDAHDWMKALTKQIIFLGGDTGYGIPAITSPTTLTGLLSDALALETAKVKPYEDAIEVCRLARDDASRNLLEHLRKWGNGHLKWLMIQLNLIDEVGESEYLTEKLG